MLHPKIIFRIIGLLLFIEAIFLGGSVVVAWYYNEPIITELLTSILTMVGVGSVLTAFCRGTELNL